MSRLVPRVLAADDQPDVLEALRLLLKPEGFLLETADSPAAVLAAVESRELDVVLIDLNYTRDTTSGREGMDLLSKLQAIDATLPVLVMTAWGSVEVAVEAMRRGARDFVQKPWENARLVATLRTQAELSRALRRGQRLEAENRALRDEGRPLLIAESEAMRPVLEMIERVGPSDANVLVTGENGTGKGTVAAALHAVSTRAQEPLLDRPLPAAGRDRGRPRRGGTSRGHGLAADPGAVRPAHAPVRQSHGDAQPAIATAMVEGPPAGLERLAALDADGRLAGRHRLDAVRAHLLEMAGDHEAAIDHYLAAASRTTSLPEQRYLNTRAARFKATPR